MVFFLLLIASLAVWAVVAAVHDVIVDGYHRVPTRREVVARLR